MPTTDVSIAHTTTSNSRLATLVTLSAALPSPATASATVSAPVPITAAPHAGANVRTENPLCGAICS